MGQTTQIFTYVLSGATMLIDGQDGAKEISLLVTSGTVTILGNAFFKGLTAAPTTLATGNTITITTTNSAASLDGITINASGGSVNIVVIK